jgi:hypothetical protein
MGHDHAGVGLSDLMGTGRRYRAQHRRSASHERFSPGDNLSLTLRHLAGPSAEKLAGSQTLCRNDRKFGFQAPDASHPLFRLSLRFQIFSAAW